MYVLRVKYTGARALFYTILLFDLRIFKFFRALFISLL